MLPRPTARSGPPGWLARHDDRSDATRAGAGPGAREPFQGDGRATPSPYARRHLSSASLHHRAGRPGRPDTRCSSVSLSMTSPARTPASAAGHPSATLSTVPPGRGRSNQAVAGETAAHGRPPRDEGAVARRPQIRTCEADLEHCVKRDQQNEREDNPEFRWETVDGNAVVQLGSGHPVYMETRPRRDAARKARTSTQGGIGRASSS